MREAARGQRVLNLFSYTGAFGVAAAAGGAAEVTNVDPNRDYLAWSLRNAALNGVKMRVLPDTAQDHLAKHLRRLARNPEQGRYDLVIVESAGFRSGAWQRARAAAAVAGAVREPAHHGTAPARAHVQRQGPFGRARTSASWSRRSSGSSIVSNASAPT